MEPNNGTLLSVIKRLHAPIYQLRLRGLLKQITPHLRKGDRVLDVGCGFGILGRAIMESPACPPQVMVTGLERIKRDVEYTPVQYYDGHKIPHPNNTFDVVLLVDVLHHATNPHNLIHECARVARRVLIVKDHKKKGVFAQLRISLMDWASNMPYGIPCFYQYNTAQEWTRWHERHDLVVEHEMHSMKLYPPVMNLIFGGGIQYLAVLRTDGASG